MTAPRPAPDPAVVHIAAGAPASGGYDVHIGPGLLERFVDIVQQAVPAHRFVVIADDRVARLYGGALLGHFDEAGVEAGIFTFPAGEPAKTRETWGVLTDAMIAADVGRDACVVGFGGGVTGDLAGFIAATYMRGLPFVQAPTSLLAMIDASVGGKTGVNLPGGKNLVGAFHQPRVVVADTALLRTLPDVELRSGLAEAVKHGMIADAGHLDWIEAMADAILDRDVAILAQLIQTSVAIKARIVATDPFERAERATLNFGHTIGHALERISGYSLAHGLAVAAGMVIESRIGEAAGISAPGTTGRLVELLARLGLPASAPSVEPAAVIEAMRSDKKGRAARVRYALVARPGVSACSATGEWTFEIEPALVRTLLADAVVALSQEDTDV